MFSRTLRRIIVGLVSAAVIGASGFVMASRGMRVTSGARGGVTATEPSLEQRVIDLAARLRELPTRDGSFDDLTRYCSTEMMHVMWSKPSGTFAHGAYVEPLGPAPGADATNVNGVLVCTGSAYAYMGFEATRSADGWDVVPVPEVGGDESHTAVESKADQADPGLTPRALPSQLPAALPRAPVVVPKPKPLPGHVTKPKPRAPVPARSSASFTGDIEQLSSYDPQSTCDPTPKPGVLAFRKMILASYPGTGSLGITRGCSVGGTSEHKEGRAWDWRANVHRPAEKAAAEKLFSWLFANDEFGNGYAMARRLGIMYIVYNHHIWGAYRADQGWRAYNGANPHTDHAHISLSWPGAEGKTSFWTGKVAPPVFDTGGSTLVGSKTGGGHTKKKKKTTTSGTGGGARDHTHKHRHHRHHDWSGDWQQCKQDWQKCFDEWMRTHGHDGGPPPAPDPSGSGGGSGSGSGTGGTGTDGTGGTGTGGTGTDGTGSGGTGTDGIGTDPTGIGGGGSGGGDPTLGGGDGHHHHHHRH